MVDQRPRRLRVAAADDVGPTLTPDGLTLYFASNASTDDDIFVTPRATLTSQWSTPVALPFSSPPRTAPSRSSTARTRSLLLSASDRGGTNDLYLVRRATPADPRDAPQPLSELDASGAEGDPWLSPDERVIVCARNRAICTASR